MLFNMTPLKEGKFLNVDCSVPPSRRRNKAFSRGPLQSPLPAQGPPQGLVDDSYLKHGLELELKRERKHLKDKHTGWVMLCWSNFPDFNHLNHTY